MKTNLDTQIQDTEQAIAFLTELHHNNEDFHPEDDAHDIIWNGIPKAEIPTSKEQDQLNKLMEQCWIHCDPCEILVNLDQ